MSRRSFARASHPIPLATFFSKLLAAMSIGFQGVAMRSASVLVVLAVMSLLGACGDKPAAPKPAASEEKSVFDPQLRALDKARGVEQTLQQGDEVQRKSIDEAGK